MFRIFDSADDLSNKWGHYTRENFLPCLSFLSLVIMLSMSLSFVGLQGQKSQAFGSAGAIQLPVCHNAGSTRCGNCQLMAVYPPQKLASQCLPKLRTCQPMIVEPCTSQTMPAKSQDAVSFCSTENWWISESFGWMENSQLNFREKKKSPSCCPTFSFQRLVPSFSFQNIFSIRFWQKMKNVFCIRRIVFVKIVQLEITTA